MIKRRKKRSLLFPLFRGFMAMLLITIVPASGITASWDLGDGLKVDWTNTFRYTAALRVADRDSELLANSSNPNAKNLDDGDQNFSTGLISNRIELYSELDAVKKNVFSARDMFGARVSAMGWYDTEYNRSNNNPGTSQNHTSQDFDEFTDDTRDQHGRDVELRDAFIFGKFPIGMFPLTVRAGQHALVWGESLFFANNAIAGAQSPYDINRLLDDPTAQAKEFVLPVPQVSAQLQFSNDLSLSAYYQFRYEPNRIPAVGSYFSTTDLAVEGAEQLLVFPGYAAPRDSDMDPSDSGQYGIQLRWLLGETDLGFYYLRFHSKDFQQVVRLGQRQPFGPFGPTLTLPTSYYLTYHEDVELFGMSASRSFGDVNLAVEGSIRTNQDLASSHAVDLSALTGGAVKDNADDPAYATGDTAHVNLSAIWTVPRTPLWNEASLVAEMAWNHVLSYDKNCDSPGPGQSAALDPNATRDAVSVRAVFEPTYRQVFPGLDISVPLGIGYTPKGSRSSITIGGFPPENGGDVTIGISGLYMNKWDATVAYTHFFGSSGTFLDDAQSFSYDQARGDRDFISFTLRRSF